MKIKSRSFIIGLIFLLALLVVGVGYVFINNNKISLGNKTSENTIIYEGNTKKRPLNSGVFILTDDLKKYGGTYAAFTSIGYDVLSGSFEEYKRNSSYNGAFIFPEEMSKTLSNEDIELIKSNVKDGQKVVVIGKSKLSEALGIKVDFGKKITSYTMKGHDKQIIEIENGMPSYNFKKPDGFETLAKNSSDGTDVMVRGNLGKGKVIYSGSELAPSKGSGYEYYPLFLEAFSKEFKLSPVFSRNNGAIYVDIGYHLGVDTPEQLAERAKKWGYNQINIGIWSSLTDDNVNYYKGIIEECHKRGIKVFAWFELPMVSIEFWDKHPEWRQKTADGKDAKIDWRYLMALENKECFDAVKKDVKERMNMFDFDGIDIAEIYYDSPGMGFMDPSIFTPMNDAFREDFKKNHGFDPKDIFNLESDYYWKNNESAKNKLIEERVKLVTSQNEDMLKLSEEIRKEKNHLEVSLTMIDSIADNRMRINIGLDSNEIVKLQNKYNFILNIEDPFTLWSLGPERYSIIGKDYRKIMQEDKSLYIDINIVDRFGQNYPTKKQRGTEIYSLIHNASKYTDKVIMYSLSTPEKEDMNLAPYAYAYDVTGKELSKNVYEFDSKANFIWHIDTKNKDVYVDDKKYPIYTKDYVVVPYGKHKVELKDAEGDSIHITDINADIKSSYYENDGIKVEYKSVGRCFVNLTRKPDKITIDGGEISPEIKELGGTYTVFLPVGEHTVTIK